MTVRSASSSRPRDAVRPKAGAIARSASIVPPALAALAGPTALTVNFVLAVLIVPPNAATQDHGLFRVWSRPVLRPIDYGEDLPYRQAPSPSDGDWIGRLDGFAARCEPVGMPGVMATPYPFEFRNHGSWIQLLGFSNNARIDRTIHMDGGAGEATPEPGRFGYSIGRWERDNRLEVRTTRIDWPYFDDSLRTSFCWAHRVSGRRTWRSAWRSLLPSPAAACITARSPRCWSRSWKPRPPATCPGAFAC